MKNCPHEATLHAYVDGELSQESQNLVTKHLTACAACAKAVQEAHAEIDLIADAFSINEFVRVPTERLHANIKRAISHSSAASPERKRLGGLRSIPVRLENLFGFGNRSFNPVYASLIFVVLLGAIAATLIKFNDTQTDVTDKRTPPDSSARQATGKRVEPEAVNIFAQTDETKTAQQQPPTQADETKFARPESDAFASQGLGTRRKRAHTITVASLVNSARNNLANKSGTSTAKLGVPDYSNAPGNAELLPGEKSYLDAIASLETNVAQPNRERTLSESMSDEYKHNLAIIDAAIAATRRTAASDPTDTVAANFLRDAYQSKLELLASLQTQADANRNGSASR